MAVIGGVEAVWNPYGERGLYLLRKVGTGDWDDAANYKQALTKAKELGLCPQLAGRLISQVTEGIKKQTRKRKKGSSGR